MAEVLSEAPFVEEPPPAPGWPLLSRFSFLRIIFVTRLAPCLSGAGLIPSLPMAGKRRLRWRDSAGRAAEDNVRQAAFAFLMALQVRQMESPFLYM